MYFGWIKYLRVKSISPMPREHYWFTRQALNPKVMKELASQIARTSVTVKKLLPKGRRWRGDVGVLT